MRDNRRVDHQSNHVWSDHERSYCSRRHYGALHRELHQEPIGTVGYWCLLFQLERLHGHHAQWFLDLLRR